MWFLGGIMAAIAIVVAGVGIASAAFTPSTADTVTPAVKTAGCGCGQGSACGGGCAAKGGAGTCGCGQKGQNNGGNFVDANQNGICDKME